MKAQIGYRKEMVLSISYRGISISLSGDDVVRETGRELGFARIGANVSDSINWAVKYSVNQGKVKKTDDGGYSLTEEYGEKLRKFIVKTD